MDEKWEPCPFCGGTNCEEYDDDDDIYFVCDRCATYGPNESFIAKWNTLHVPTVIDRLSRQLGVDFRKWLSPMADEEYRERDLPVPWEEVSKGYVCPRCKSGVPENAPCPICEEATNE